jgi:hypothetical protein
MPVNGTCLCGGVRFEVTEPFELLVSCHCESCKKLSGGAATVNGRVRTDAVHILEGADLLTRFTPLDGSAKTFCSRCGSNLFGAGWPDSTKCVVRLALLDVQPERGPDLHVFVRSVAPWETMPDDGAPRYDTRPG